MLLARVCCLAIACSFLPLAAVAVDVGGQQAGTNPSPPETAGVPQPVRSYALDDGNTSLTGNPGGLAFGAGLTLGFAHDEGFAASSPGHGNGLYLTDQLGPVALGFGAEWQQRGSSCTYATPCPRRLTYGLGLKLGEGLGVGVAYHTFSDDSNLDIDRLSSFDLGMLARLNRYLTVGAAVLDVNGPASGQQLIPRRFAFSFGARPFGEVATLGVDAVFRSCVSTTFSGPKPCGGAHPDLFVTLDAVIATGVHFLGQVGALDSSNGPITLQAGLQLDLGHASVRAAPRFREDSSARGGFRVAIGSTEGPSFSPIHRSRAVEIDLGSALELPKAGALALLFGSDTEDPLARTLSLLKRLAHDSGVRAVVFKLDNLPLGMGRAEELRNRIEELRSAGKKVIFYLESGGDLEYYVASTGDRVFAAPQAALTVNGFSATAYFAAAGLDKLGVKAEFFRVGAYKNAPDFFTRSDMSSEQREVAGALLDDQFGRYLRALVEKRHLDPVKLKTLLDKGLLKPAEAVEAGLIDGLIYPDQLEEEVSKLVGATVSLEKNGERGAGEEGRQRNDRWGSPPRIAVIRVEGDILRGKGGQAPLGAVKLAGSDGIARRIREAADNPGVAAIVVRIDSPGGDGNASDLIWRELQRARVEKKKPVVASMGDVAASGGYYVAVGADEIFAEPSTITGSIGVFVGHFDADELFGKLGVSTMTIKRGESADIFSPTRGLTDVERKMFQSWVDSFYQDFISRVAGGRNLSNEEVDKVGRGRVWTGAQALERKLVDQLGGLDDAIASAKKRAGLRVDDAVQIDDEEHSDVDVQDLALGGTLAQARDSMPGKLYLQAARTLQILGEPGTVRARLPFDLEVR